MASAMIAALLAATVCALPASSPAPTCKATAYRNANFEDLTGLPALPNNLIPTPYKGLKFQGFRLVSVLQTNLLPGTLPHSDEKLAFSDSVVTTVAGTAEWTTNYQDSVVKSFTPTSFYYGCDLDLKNGAAAVPTACNIAITGFAAGDNTNEMVQVASQEFSYNPSTSLGAQDLALGIFNDDFVDLEYVLIQYTLEGGEALLNADLGLAIDDVRYSTCT